MQPTLAGILFDVALNGIIKFNMGRQGMGRQGMGRQGMGRQGMGRQAMRSWVVGSWVARLIWRIQIPGSSEAVISPKKSCGCSYIIDD